MVSTIQEEAICDSEDDNESDRFEIIKESKKFKKLKNRGKGIISSIREKEDLGKNK